jgi:hypothetical protein
LEGFCPLTILASPLSEVAYQMADTNIAKDIVKLNADVATAFGVFLNGVDIISTIPSNANDGAVANDDAGKIGATLAIISQMAATNGNSATVVKRDFTNSPTYKCVKYIINIVFDRSFASSYTNLSLKSTYCTAEFTGKSLVLYGSL